MTADERAELKRRIDARRRELAQVEVCPLGYGTETGYVKGCRCDLCRTDASAKRRARAHANIEAHRAYNRAYKARYRATKRLTAELADLPASDAVRRAYLSRPEYRREYERAGARAA